MSNNNDTKEDVVPDSIAQIKEFRDLTGSLGFKPFGNSYTFMRNAYKFLSKRFVEAGDLGIFKMDFAFQKFVMIGDPEVADYILKRENKLVVACWLPHQVILFGPESIFNVKHERHTLFRRLLDKAFQPTVMNESLPHVINIVRESLDAFVAKGVKDMHEETKALTFKLAIELLVGRRRLSGEEIAEMRKWYNNYVIGLGGIPVSFPGSAYNRSLRDRKKLFAKLRDVASSIMKEEEVGTDDVDSVGSLISILVNGFQDGDEMNLDQITDNLVAMLFAGGDTSSSAMVILIVALHNRPDLVTKLRAEQQAFIEANGAEYTREQLFKDMPLLNAVIKELLWVIPVILAVPRQAIVDFVVPGTNLTIRKGQRMYLQLLGCHYHDMPDKINASWEYKLKMLFNPEEAMARSERGEPDPRLIFSFGKGARGCIGRPLAEMELRVFVVELMRGYKFSLTGSNYPPFKMPAIPTPAKPMKVKFQKL